MFIGFRSNNEIPYYLKSADILIAPYLMKSKIFGRISLIKVYDYMAAKIPSIISNIPRLKEICDNEENEILKPVDIKDKEINKVSKGQVGGYTSYLNEKDNNYVKKIVIKSRGSFEDLIYQN